MSDWNDPRTTQSPFGKGPALNGTTLGAVTMDEGLRRHMLSIYNYMASGVLLSGLIAMLMVRANLVQPLFQSGLGIVSMFVPVGIALAMVFGFARMSETTVKVLYWIYCIAFGLMMSLYLTIYTGASVALAFFSAAGAFAGLSLVGYTTKRNLSAMGAFMVMGLIGIIIASIANFFIGSSALSLALSYISVVVFSGLIAWHTQAFKEQYAYVAGTPDEGKSAVYAALVLYTDFVNLFLALLRILGNRN